MEHSIRTLVLNADSDTERREARQAALTATGFDVVGVADGAAALAAVETESSRPLLILLREPWPADQRAALVGALGNRNGTPAFLVALGDAAGPPPAGADLGLRDFGADPDSVAALSGMAILLERQARERARSTRPAPEPVRDRVRAEVRTVPRLGQAKLPPGVDAAGQGTGRIYPGQARHAQTELNLRQQQEMLQTLLDQVPIMIWFSDGHGRVRFTNRCFTETLGWPLEDYENRDLLTELTPDPAERARVLECLRDPAPGFSDFDMRTREGRSVRTAWAWAALPDGTRLGLGLDLTERERTETEMKRLAQIIEATTDIVSTADLSGRMTYMNRAGRQFFQLHPDQDLRDTRIADYHPDWAYRLLGAEGLPKAIRHGSWTGDTALIRGDGREIQVSQLIIAHKTPQGTVGCVSTVMRDIDQRKREEQALRFERALFEGLQTAAPIGLAFVDWNTRFIRCNDALAEMNGLPAAAHIGQPVSAVVPDLWPILETVYRRVLENGEVVANFELAGETRAYPGVLRHWLLNLYPLWVGGEVVAVGIVVQEITDRIRTEQALRDSERRLDMALMGAEMGSWDWDVDTGQLWLDDRWARLFGPVPEAVVADIKVWTTLIHPDDRERVTEALQTHLAGHTPFYESEYRIMTSAGRWAWVVARGRVLERDADGTAVRVAGMYRDIGTRKALEARLEQQQEQLLHVQRLTTAGELVALVGHELNQPLAAINNFLGGAKLRFRAALAANPGLAEALDEAVRQSQRAAAVVSGLRELVRGQDSRREWVPVTALVKDSLLLAEAELRRRQVHLEVDLAADLPNLWAQRVYLQQLLLNLYLNAMEAMQGSPPDRRILLVAARKDGQDGIEFQIRDSGNGIAPAVVDTLFDPFVSTKPDGIGLGLSICRTIVEAHEGRITVESRPGEGSLFRIRLPIIKPDAPAAAT